jgi:hypothetical protein
MLKNNEEALLGSMKTWPHNFCPSVELMLIWMSYEDFFSAWLVFNSVRWFNRVKLSAIRWCVQAALWLMIIELCQIIAINLEL